ncbi:unnamed protein product [Miscanthus lutarioriparius]|uniref:CCHC-type domain-containing protein n=1 Tax=Miscanthus lutarioriparius TaxID=422564 RepID=A0A811NG76_9POAL|nr:unnamed protein product [Miscanthus lutarioriparius]
MGDNGASGSGNHGVRESSLVWPMLDQANYAEWAMLVQCNLEALEIWHVIDPGTNVKRSQDRQAMSALLRSVPKEMWQMLGNHKTVKEAWEAVQTMHLGADRVKEVNAQKLLQEFENIAFRDGETIDQFGMRITNLVANLRTLGETVEDACVVKKFLRVVPSRFTPVVVSIEMFCDIKTMKVEELVGRLRAAEDRLDVKVEHIIDKTGRLLMAEEEWMEKHKHRFHSGPKDGGGGGSSGGQSKGKAVARSDGRASALVKLTSEGTPRRKGRCRNCGIYGHWAQDCKRPKKEKKEPKNAEANVAVDGGDPALMLATCDVAVAGRTTQIMHLAENVVPADVPDGLWNKLSDRSSKMIFIGYETGTKGYRFFNPATSKLVVSRDVIFEENKPWDWTNAQSSTVQQPSETFVVHYKETDTNPTMGNDTENAVLPEPDAVGHGPADQGGVVGPEEAAPNSPITPNSSAAPNFGWATPQIHLTKSRFGPPDS